MLVLARRLNERIVIPCIQTTVQIVGVQSGVVRLGIEAPAEVKVFREEILRNEPPVDTNNNRFSTHQNRLARLADAAQSVALLRRQLQDQLPANAAATLDQIDNELEELAREMEETPAANGDPRPEPTLAVPAQR